LDYAGVVEEKGRDCDKLGLLRFEKEYVNVLLVEQPNGDFGDTLMRQFLFDAFRKPLYERLVNSSDKQLAAIADKSLKETRYHLKHSSEWVIRLGDGTEESHTRIQSSLDILWRYSAELFYSDEVETELTASGILPDLSGVRSEWVATVNSVFQQATIVIPSNNWKFEGGRLGRHSEHFGHLLSELQYMQRAFPNSQW
jgi:ring-1,2-phenylacetyl-CoA epoxidase subunit PaaC